MKLRIALLLALLAVLVWTNPNEEDFRDQAQAEIRKQVDAGSELEQALGSLLSGPISELILSRTERSNYLLASVFSFEVDKKTYRYLGIATMIIPLQKEQPFDQINEQ